MRNESQCCLRNVNSAFNLFCVGVFSGFICAGMAHSQRFAIFCDVFIWHWITTYNERVNNVPENEDDNRQTHWNVRVHKSKKTSLWIATQREWDRHKQTTVYIHSTKEMSTATTEIGTATMSFISFPYPVDALRCDVKRWLIVILCK